MQPFEITTPGGVHKFVVVDDSTLHLYVPGVDHPVGFVRRQGTAYVIGRIGAYGSPAAPLTERQHSDLLGDPVMAGLLLASRCYGIRPVSNEVAWAVFAGSAG